MSCGIYKIQNKINGKIYIGQSVEIERRWQKHLNAQDDFAIHKALRKYGKDNFIFEIIETCQSNELDDNEIYWIDFYKSLIPNGYNMIPGGSNHVGKDKSKPVEQFSLDGKFIAEFASAAEASRQTGIDHSAICACCKDNNSKQRAGKFQWRYKNSDKSISPLDIKTDFTVLQLSLTGEVISSFGSLNEAAQKTGTNASCICACCKGKHHTANGFHWCYPEDLEKLQKSFNKSLKPCKSKIQQFDLDGNLLAEYATLQEAHEASNQSVGIISECTTGKRTKAGKYVWKRIKGE